MRGVGPTPEYQRAHWAVKKEHGRAAKYVCSCGCGARADEWALLPGPHEVDGHGLAYSTDIDRYVPMSRRCHRRLDLSNLDACLYGHARTPETTYRAPNGTEECRTCRTIASRERKRRLRSVA